MASKMKALSAYRPRIKMGRLTDVREVARLISGRTSLNESGVYEALLELKWVLDYCLKAGRSVRLTGIGLFSPTIKLDGKIKTSFRLEKGLSSELNKDAEGFEGKIINNDMIGKTVDDLVTRWNDEHPEDPVVET